MSPCAPLHSADLDHVLACTSEAWEEARGKSFFITGGTGFFGMWLLESFAYVNDALRLGMRAVVLSRDPVAFSRKAPHLFGRKDLEFVQGDIRAFKFPPGRFAYAIHAATEASVRLNEENPAEMFEAIVGGTRRVLEFSAQAGVEKLLVTSSGAVYGRQPPELTHVPESFTGAPDPLLSGSAYGEGKRVSEHISVVDAVRHGYMVKIARCFAFVGPHLPLDGHFAIGNFIRDALKGETIQVNGDGTPRRSYLYAADLAIWLWVILFKAPSGRAYNVGSPEDVSIAELAGIVSAKLGGKSKVRVAQMPDIAHPAIRYVPAVDRARTELGLQARISLVDAVGRTAEWLGGFRWAGT